MSSKHLLLTEFITNFFLFYDGHVQERDKIAENCIIKRPVLSIKTQQYTTKSHYCKKTVTSFSCTCTDFNSMMLPCRHIFKIRQLKKESLYSEDLCGLLSTKMYYENHQRILKSINLNDNLDINERIGDVEDYDLKDLHSTSLSKEKFQNLTPNIQINTDGTRRSSFEANVAFANLENLQNISDDIINVRNNERIHDLEENLQCVNLEKQNNKRGRPKGTKIVDIMGLKKKRKVMSVLFKDKTTVEKSSVLLSLFLEESKITKVINGFQLVEPTDISVDKIQCSLYEEYKIEYI